MGLGLSRIRGGGQEKNHPLSSSLQLYVFVHSCPSMSVHVCPCLSKFVTSFPCLSLSCPCPSFTVSRVTIHVSHIICHLPPVTNANSYRPSPAICSKVKIRHKSSKGKKPPFRGKKPNLENVSKVGGKFSATRTGREG